MKTWIVTALLIVAAGLALAQMPRTKAGLWETKIVKNVVDGKDMTAQMNDAMTKMRAQLAQMTPEQRAMVESHFQEMAGGGANAIGTRSGHPGL